jgi:hypothetical protein
VGSLSNEFSVGREDEVLRDRPQRPHSTVIDRTEHSNGAAWLAIPVDLRLDLIAAPGGASKLNGLGPTAQPDKFAVGAPTVAIQMPPKHGRRFPVVHGDCMSSSNSAASYRDPRKTGSTARHAANPDEARATVRPRWALPFAPLRIVRPVKRLAICGERPQHIPSRVPLGDRDAIGREPLAMVPARDRPDFARRQGRVYDVRVTFGRGQIAVSKQLSCTVQMSCPSSTRWVAKERGKRPAGAHLRRVSLAVKRAPDTKTAAVRRDPVRHHYTPLSFSATR